MIFLLRYSDHGCRSCRVLGAALLIGCGGSPVASGGGSDARADAVACTSPGSYRVRVSYATDTCPQTDELIDVPIPLDGFQFYPQETTVLTQTGPCAWTLQARFEPIEGRTFVDGTVVALSGDVRGDFYGTYTSGDAVCEFTVRWRLEPAP